MKKLLFFIAFLMAILISGCSIQHQTVTENLSQKIQSTDGKISMSFPSNWINKDNESIVSVLSMHNISKNENIIVFISSHPQESMDHYIKSTIDSYSKTMKDVNVKSIASAVIGKSYMGQQIIFTATDDLNQKLKHSIYVYTDNKNFYKIDCYSLESKFNNNISECEKIIETFTILQ